MGTLQFRSHCADLISARAISERRTRHWVGRVYDQRVPAVTRKKAEEYRRLAQQCHGNGVHPFERGSTRQRAADGAGLAALGG